MSRWRGPSWKAWSIATLSVLPHTLMVMDDGTLRNASGVLAKEWLWDLNDWLTNPLIVNIGYASWIAYWVLCLGAWRTRGLLAAGVTLHLLCRLADRAFVSTALAGYDKAPEFSMADETVIALALQLPLALVLFCQVLAQLREGPGRITT